jgi:hypothetical protein
MTKAEFINLTSNTCHRSYIRQTSNNLKLRFQEHTWYTKHNELQSAYTLHILNCKHEYGTISDTMSLLKQTDKPSPLLLYEQMYIQLFYHNNQLIPEQHPNEQNPMFQLFHNWYHMSHPTWHLNQYFTSTQPNQFHCTLHTRQSSTQVCLSVHQLYFYSFND